MLRNEVSDDRRFISVVQSDVAAASGESHLYRLFIATKYLSRYKSDATQRINLATEPSITQHIYVRESWFRSN